MVEVAGGQHDAEARGIGIVPLAGRARVRPLRVSPDGDLGQRARPADPCTTVHPRRFRGHGRTGRGIPDAVEMFSILKRERMSIDT